MRVRSIGAVVVVLIGFALHAQELELQPWRGERPLLRAAGEQRTPANASDGRDFISAWVDSRGGERGRSIWANIESGSGQIFVNIVRRDGSAVSPYGIRVSGANRHCSNPAVVWSGTHYVVAWAHVEERGLAGVAFARVSRDGVVLDAEPREVFSLSTSYPVYPMLAAGPRGVILGMRGLTDHGLAAIADDGTTLADVTGVAELRGMAIVAKDDSFLVLELVPRTGSPERTDLYSSPLTIDDGRLVRGVSRLLVNDVSRWTLAAATRGDETLLVYERDEVHTRVLRADGTVSAEIAPGIDAAALSVIAHGDGFLLAWSERAGEVRNPWYGAQSISAQYVPPPLFLPTYDISATQLDADGRVRDTYTLIEGGESDEMPSIASNGGELLVSWVERIIRAPIGLKIAAAISSDGVSVERVALAHSRPRQQTPEIAAGADGYLAVWAEETANDGIRSIVAQRIDREGRALQHPRLIGGGALDQHAPKIAFDGETFLVVWVEETRPQRIIGRRIGADGALLDGAPLEISRGRIGGLPSVASNGRDFVVAYGSAYGDMRRDEQTVQLVRIDGNMIAPPVTFTPGDAEIDSDIVVAASGDDYVVVWQSRGKIYSAPLGNFMPRANPAITWWRDPLVSCDAQGCLAISSEWVGTVARPFHPFVEAQQTPAVLSIPYDPRTATLTRDDSGHVAVWVVPTENGDIIRARLLTTDGTAASEEIDLASAVAVRSVAAAMLDGNLAIAYARDGRIRVERRRLGG